MNPSVNYGLWVTMMYRFINIMASINTTSVTLWGGILLMGEVMHMVGQGGFGNFLYFPLNFSMKLKLF